MNVLIETVPNDIHSCAIKWLMEIRGHNAILFSMTNYPAASTLSFHISNERFVIDELPDHFDVCITRRRGATRLADDIHPADKVYASREAKVVIDAYSEFIKGNPFYINHPASNRSNNKMLQLKFAAEIGLRIPATLISNNSEEIECFLLRHNSVVYKSFYPALWQGEVDDYLLFTEPVCLNNVMEFKESLRFCPGIFQERIDKSYEVRAVFMGKTCRAVKILSKNGSVSLDWRKNNLDGSGLVLSPVNLPEKIYQYCINLMECLNVVFGCFDFCVNSAGDYYFLEINPMGQFLWMEDNREICLLSTFCDFVESQNSNFLASQTSDHYFLDDAINTPAFMKIMNELAANESDKDSYAFAE